jgi:diaminopimelate decarboxylase
MPPDPTIAELIAARPALTTDALTGLLFEGASLHAIAQAHGTPTWVYGAATLQTRANRLQTALPATKIHFAVKANDHLAILAHLARQNLGADVVSAGELLRAATAGFPPENIVFSGVGKTDAELTLALNHRIGQINVESAEELHALSRLAQSANTTAPVALRINPDVDAGTHAKITTGRAENKFGIPIAEAATLYAQAATLPGIAVKGLAVHIGSQVTTTAPFTTAYEKLAALAKTLLAQNLPLATIDCGGGLGYGYRNEPALLPEAWAATIARAFAGLPVTTAVEPGRWIAAPAGILLTRIIRTRRAGRARPVVILDAAMNDLLRPAMYDAWHGVIPAAAPHLHAATETVDLAGPVCESSDILGRARALPPMPDGALVAVLDTGAYGAAMSSTYNARPLAAQVMVQNGRAALIRPRATLESLWAAENVPDFTAQ